MSQLLGGTASPIGWAVQYLDAPLAAVEAAVRDVRGGARLKVREGLPYPESLAALTPFEAPWTRELLMPCGRWTAYLNNGLKWR